MNRDLNVLIVEDSAADAELIMHKLYEMSYHLELKVVETPADTREAISEKPWDVILCDYSMPNFDPYKVLDILNELKLDIPIIVISGKIGEDNAIKLLKAGFQDCIMKSDLGRLPEVINREIKEARVKNENKELSRKLQKYKILCDATNDIMFFLDKAGNILDVNSAAVRCYGYSYEDLLKMNIVDLRHISDMKLINSQMKVALNNNIIYETIHYRKDNTSFCVEVSAQSSILNSEKIVFCIVRDITERKQNEKLKEQNLKDLLESQRIAHIGTWRLNIETNQVIWSEELYKMYGFDSSLPPPPYTEHMKLFTPESWEKLSTSLEITRTVGVSYELELETVKADESNGWMWVRGEADTDSSGNIIFLWGAAQDITERKKTENKLRYYAYHDQLTGLYNRTFFEEELKRLDTKKYLPLSIIMFDFNGLKLINESFGHNIGDIFLTKTAEIIKKTCSLDSIVFRIGGDEFVTLLPNTDLDETAHLAQHIKELSSLEKVSKIELSISYGYDTKKNEDQAILDIFANAENHMYRHKLYERRSTRSKTVDLIMNTLFEKSNRELHHSARVSNICKSIATKMNFDKISIEKIKVSGLLHDIGKIGVDEKILNKVGSLSNSEWREIQRHPEVGWRILSATNEFSELAQFVLDHHEKWDGSGYPNGLKGEEIPIEARIIKVADAFDAMTSIRTYKKAYSMDEAIRELKRYSGSQFDPNIVDVFVNQVLPFNLNFSEE